MKKRIYILANGILTWPGALDKWTDRGVTWIMTETPYRAEKFEYFSRIFTRRLRQQWRAEQLARLIDTYAAKGFEIYIVVHSNGADVAKRALNLIAASTRIEEIHFIAPACDPDETFALLSTLCKAQRLGTFFCYIGGRDGAMKLAKFSKAIGGFFGLGYGAMGGMEKMDLTLKLMTANIPGGVFREDTYDHSAWFENDNFEKTMRCIVT